MEALYKCISCGHEEQSEDITPKLMMQGKHAMCSKCGAKSEAVWGHTSLPGWNNAKTTTHFSTDRINRAFG